MDPARRAFFAARSSSAPQAEARIAVAPACLAQHGIECRICAELCETRALRFVPARGGIAQLVVAIERCTGCADCIAPCPAQALSLAVPRRGA